MTVRPFKIPKPGSPLLDYVRFYRALGLCVIPVPFGRKAPVVQWRAYQHRKPTPAEIQAWFGGRESNLAVVCGKISGNVIVLDFDDVAVYRKFFNTEKIESGTIVVRTGSGKRHVYLHASDPVPSFKIPQLKLEVRSDGNIVVLPPSMHPCGRRYEFINPDVGDIPVVPNLPKAVLDIAKKKFGVDITFDIGTPRPPRGQWKFREPYRGPDPPCILKLMEGVSTGFRNEAAARLVSYFLTVRKLELGEAWRNLKKWNARNPQPLHDGEEPPGELRRVFDSIARGGYTYGCRGLAAYCDSAHCPFTRKAAHEASERFLRELVKPPPVRIEEISDEEGRS